MNVNRCQLDFCSGLKGVVSVPFKDKNAASFLLFGIRLIFFFFQYLRYTFSHTYSANEINIIYARAGEVEKRYSGNDFLCLYSVMGRNERKFHSLSGDPENVALTWIILQNKHRYESYHLSILFGDVKTIWTRTFPKL